jgi:hypothetical protein
LLLIVSVAAPWRNSTFGQVSRTFEPPGTPGDEGACPVLLAMAERKRSAKDGSSPLTVVPDDEHDAAISASAGTDKTRTK